MAADVLVPKEPIPSDKSSAAASEEARLFEEGDLEQQARKHRSSRMRHLHLIALICIWTVAVVGAVVGGMSL
ncbi:MAG: hypothetical protein OXH75_00340 [Acidobacteria bacterium]|nr:hypothetical protein [Acidobacteriota bacterium]